MKTDRSFTLVEYRVKVWLERKIIFAFCRKKKCSFEYKYYIKRNVFKCVFSWSVNQHMGNLLRTTFLHVWLKIAEVPLPARTVVEEQQSLEVKSYSGRFWLRTCAHLRLYLGNFRLGNFMTPQIRHFINIKRIICSIKFISASKDVIKN